MENQSGSSSAVVVSQSPSPFETLIVTADYPNVTPERLYEYWTIPALLCSWWPQVAELDVRVGGAYLLSWPQMNWRLRGRYTAVAPGARLAFTWVWEHEVADVRGAEVIFAPLPGGAKVTVRHGPYADTPADRETRNGHIEGWLHFLGQLGDRLAQDAQPS